MIGESNRFSNWAVIIIRYKAIFTTKSTLSFDSKARSDAVQFCKQLKNANFQTIVKLV